MESGSALVLRRLLLIAAAVLVFGLTLTACKADKNTAQTGSKGTPGKQAGSHGEAPRLSTPPEFRWDFSSEKDYVYDYEQEGLNKTNLHRNNSGDVVQKMSTRGSLIMKSHGDGTADLVLKDVKMTTKVDMGEDEAPKTIEQTAPPVVIQGVREDGSVKGGDMSRGALLKVLFTLPTKSLDVGESVDVPAQFPFNVMGSMLTVSGRHRVTLAGYETIGGAKCARFEVDTDISELNVPEEMEGEYKASLKGSSVLYFDMDNRRFVSGTSSALMEMSIDAPMPEMSFEGERPGKTPERMKTSMSGDSKTRFKLVE